MVPSSYFKIVDNDRHSRELLITVFPMGTACSRDSHVTLLGLSQAQADFTKMGAIVKKEAADECNVKAENEPQLDGAEAISATVKRERNHGQSEPEPRKRLRAELLADPFPNHNRPTPEECRVRHGGLTCMLAFN